jgi:multiple sugar transport system substrate-binding protein
MNCGGRSLRRAGAIAGLLLAGAAAAHAQAFSVWVHSGPGPERDGYAASVRAFNEAEALARRGTRAELVSLPEGHYAAAVDRAAAAGTLPCVLEFDGPHVAAHAAAGRLLPLDGFEALARLRASMLASLVRQGTVDGRLYGIGQYDSGLALWGNRTLIERAGVRIPVRSGDGWTLAELEDALKKLKAAGVPTPLDLKFNYGVGEWFTYGFAPLLQSLGGDLIERERLARAQGVLNGAAAVRAMTLLLGWVTAGWVDAQPRDDRAFAEGRAALSWVGHWAWQGYRQALGDQLVLMPVPRFGARPVTGSGSWNFGIAASCTQPEAAARFIAHLMSRTEILRITEVNGAVPGTGQALAFSSLYGPGGELRLFAEQLLSGQARVRPATPAYPVITAAFSDAVAQIVRGADVQATLDDAARRIDQALERSR